MGTLEVTRSTTCSNNHIEAVIAQLKSEIIDVFMNRYDQSLINIQTYCEWTVHSIWLKEGLSDVSVRWEVSLPQTGNWTEVNKPFS